ncbi:cold shock domain-containing protein [Azospirillum sp. RWY-5-1]|uniref:Cold shock domain-containing protein n=1 Tax=Azospirillum oleiclasticum TaxID=2735135 RepID=A0ABX2TLY9_9PROT|nr:cold-shock protein [Azospirillum oleiclasticum]NYZ16811.1 cold shock domain-containing protein [Azospirillum oleiclasticum]NYZ24456.1 cold shock domain-containing protein [Azospirillum oleiclasticum]
MQRSDRNHPDTTAGDPGVGPETGVEVRARVKWFDPARGFGFVSPLDGSRDAFLHIAVLNRAGLHAIADGAEVLCRLVPGPRGAQVEQLLEVLDSGAVAPGPDAPPPGQELTGTVKWYKPDKGFGFVLADDGGKDVFVHKSVLRRCRLGALDTGQRVTMRVRDALRGREAVWVAFL